MPAKPGNTLSTAEIKIIFGRISFYQVANVNDMKKLWNVRWYEQSPVDTLSPLVAVILPVPPAFPPFCFFFLLPLTVPAESSSLELPDRFFFSLLLSLVFFLPSRKLL